MQVYKIDQNINTRTCFCSELLEVVTDPQAGYYTDTSGKHLSTAWCAGVR